MPAKKKIVEEEPEESSDSESASTSSDGTEPEEPPKKKQKVMQPAGAADEIGELFEGCSEWERALKGTITSTEGWEEQLGRGRSKAIVPVRELTFQALKPNKPGDWNVVVFGQNPYPRVESATGIAMFDNSFTSWADKRFGVVTTMRCMVKAAFMSKHKIPKATPVAELRKLIVEHDVVDPAAWFQALLTQGVLLLNAVLTTDPTNTKRANLSKFWSPIITKIIETILEAKAKDGKPGGSGLVFAWWGSESLKVKKMLGPVFLKFRGKVQIHHLENANPAAQGDAFCQTPSPYTRINDTLKELGLKEVDWLPTKSWVSARQKNCDRFNEMGDFMDRTRALHKMYLDRLKDGLQQGEVELSPITGIFSKANKTLGLEEACSDIGLEAAAQASVTLFKKGKTAGLSLDEAAAVHMYTGESIYKRLNAAFRNPDRTKIAPYFPYLKLLLSGIQKASTWDAEQSEQGLLYRGVNLDLKAQYKQGTTVTWWAVNSCTPTHSVAVTFLGKSGPRTLFKVKPSCPAYVIKPFSAYKGEDEVILLPGTRLRVDAVASKPSGITEVTLSELVGERLVQ